MSISKANEHKIRFSVNKENNSPKKQPLLYYYPCYTKPSNLKNLKTDNLNTSSSTYFTSSKKNQNKNFFKVINTSLNDKINNKFKVVKTNDNNINENNNNNLNGNINNNTKTHKDINDNNTIINISENDNKANHDNHVIILEEETDTDPDMAAELKPKKVNEVDKKERLLEFFKGKKIYVEIFNGKENASEAFCDILLKYKIIQCKRLTKNIDYIIFKEGHLKTKRYAVMNNIKMVNPLWVDDKINSNIFKDDKEYFVETNMGDILVQERLGNNKNSSNDNNEKNYDNELEAEFDMEYANMIDKQRESKNNDKNKKDKNIGREKRKTKMTKNKNEIIFLNEPETKNMVIEEFLETNNSSNLFNNENKNEIMIHELKKEPKITHSDLNENNDDNSDNAPAPLSCVSPTKTKKKGIFKVEKINKNSPKKINNNNINNNIFNINNCDKNNIKEDITNNNDNNNKSNDAIKKPKCKTPDKTKSQSKLRKKRKLKTKDYKHKATSKKIMVTKVTDNFDLNLNNNLLLLENENNQNNIYINNENQNINSDNNINPFYKTTEDIFDSLNNNNNNNNNNNKSTVLEITKKDNNPKKSTLNQKINIITYKLEDQEIQCLKTMEKFEFKGDLKNTLMDYGELYSSASIVIVDKEKSKYDWKMYEFFIDKKILVDFASFLFEFITEKSTEEIIDAQNTLDILNKISINEETYFLNKKIRYQRRSVLHSLNIVENISENRIDKDRDDENNKKKINFVINRTITGGEKRILHKIIKQYLKANVIKIDLLLPHRRSQSVGPGMKFKFKSEIKNNNGRKDNIFLITKIYDNKNKMDIVDEKSNDDNEKKDDDDESNEEKNIKENIEGDTYLISKEKEVNHGIIKNIPHLKDVISYKYVFDSFWAGKLLDLQDNNILQKYKFQ